MPVLYINIDETAEGHGKIQEMNNSGSDEQFAFISDYIRKTGNAVFHDDFCDENGISAGKYLDLESAASFRWIPYFCKNMDVFAESSIIFSISATE